MIQVEKTKDRIEKAFADGVVVRRETITSRASCIQIQQLAFQLAKSFMVVAEW